MNGPYRSEAANTGQSLSWEDKLKDMRGDLSERSYETGKWQCYIHMMIRDGAEAMLYGYGASPSAAVDACHAQFTRMRSEGWRRK